MAYRVRADGLVRFASPRVASEARHTVLMGAALATAACIGFADPEIQLEEPGLALESDVVIPHESPSVARETTPTEIEPTPCPPEFEELVFGTMEPLHDEVELELEEERRLELLELERNATAQQPVIHPKPVR